jgi:hypothetical protein
MWWAFWGGFFFATGNPILGILCVIFWLWGGKK